MQYFLSHLNKNGKTLPGAGAGTWNKLAYFTNYATTGIDYLDYHVYPLNTTGLDPMVFQVDSIAHANNKRIVVGECWDNKFSDSEYVANPSQTYTIEINAERNVFDYFEYIDTLFQQTMIDLSQQANIDMVNFFQHTR